MNFEVNIRTLIASRSHNPNKVGVYRKGEKNFATNITGAEGRRLQTIGYSSYHIYITHSTHRPRIGDYVLNTIDWTISRVDGINIDFLKLKEYQVPADKCELIVASTDDYRIRLKKNSEFPSSHHEAEDRCPSCLKPVDLLSDMVDDDSCNMCCGKFTVLGLDNETIAQLIPELNKTRTLNSVPVVEFECGSCGMDGDGPKDHKMGCNHRDPDYLIWSPRLNDNDRVSLELYGGECGGELEWVDDDGNGMDIYKCLNCGEMQHGNGSTCHAEVSGDYKDVVESTNKQFGKSIKNRVCKGSMVLGTGCGECERCVDQIAQAAGPTETINKTDIMEATEAKRIAESYNKKVDDKILKEINDLIEKRATNGNFDAYYNTKPSEELYDRLKNLGYELDETDNQKNGYTLIINWG